jgi:ABC-type polysaccharide/polyol phosphate export permease
VLEFWVYLTPVMYPVSHVPPNLAWTISYNPMSVFIAAFRGGILGGEGPTVGGWISAIATVVAVFSVSVWFFHRAEARAVDNL